MKEANLLWELSPGCFSRNWDRFIKGTEGTWVGIHCRSQCYGGNLGKETWVHCLDLWNQARLTGTRELRRS